MTPELDSYCPQCGEDAPLISAWGVCWCGSCQEAFHPSQAICAPGENACEYQVIRAYYDGLNWVLLCSESGGLGRARMVQIRGLRGDEFTYSPWETPDEVTERARSTYAALSESGSRQQRPSFWFDLAHEAVTDSSQVPHGPAEMAESPVPERVFKDSFSYLIRPCRVLDRGSEECL